MSLLTALLAFVPALASKREPGTALDPEIELLQARRDRELAEDKVQIVRHQMVGLSVEIAALRRENDAIIAMLLERDRVINSLTAQSPYAPAPLPVHPAQHTVFAFDGQRQLANAQNQGRNAHLPQNNLSLVFNPGWRSCTCVPGRSAALRRRSF